MTRRLGSMLAAMLFLAVLAACGGGGGDGPDGGPDAEDVRKSMRTLLNASLRDDVEAARPYLAVGDYLSLTSSAGSQFENLSKEEQAQNVKSCFRQLASIPKLTTLRDAAAVDAAVRAADVSIQSQTRRAEIRVAGPDASGKPRQIAHVCRLTQGGDGVWRLITCELDL